MLVVESVFMWDILYRNFQLGPKKCPLSGGVR